MFIFFGRHSKAITSLFLPFKCSVVFRTGDTSVMKLDDETGRGAGARACSGISTEKNKSVYQPRNIAIKD